MIKTLGPMEDASDLASIAPVLHHWADVISKTDKHVRSMSLSPQWSATPFDGAPVY